MSSSDLDLSPPLSTLLRTHTLPAHKAAESSNGARILASGDSHLLSREEYVRYLARLWVVYRELELALAKHGPAHPLLSSIYDPSILDLSRTRTIEEDVCFFLDPSSSSPSSSPSHNQEYAHESWHTHPILSSILHLHHDASSSTSTYDPIEEPVKRYVDRIREISDSYADRPQIGLLLAHAYVRYMGDLSGGQFIRKRVAKAFDLQVGHEGVDGVKFYDFQLFDPRAEVDVDANANANAKRIKSHFRSCFDLGFARFVEDNELSEWDAGEAKLSLIKEANLAFKLSGGLFDLMQAPDPSFSSSDSSLSLESDSSIVSSFSASLLASSASSHQPNTDSHFSTLPKLSLSPIISHIYSSFAFNNNARIYAVPVGIIVAGFAISVQALRWMYQ